jgi:cyclic dehypoxanthinyl futalosine synthase
MQSVSLLKKILQKPFQGKRVAPLEAVELFRQDDFIEIGKVAFSFRKLKKPGMKVSFIIDRNINYTNVCMVRCKFCAFSRPKGHPESYTLSIPEILRKVEEAVLLGATQIMLQGGINSDLSIEYFEELFSSIKVKFPHLTLHSLTAPEIVCLSKISGLTYREVLIRLKEVGLDSLPGGGAEILVDRVRESISPRKISSEKWLKVHEEAHKLGMVSTATMVIGHVETFEDRVSHLEKVRSLQDKTGGFISFIPWIFHSGRTELKRRETSSFDYLKTLAISRLYLDNIENIQGSWLTVGREVGQLSLFFGANDLGSIMLEENVVRATGYKSPQMTVEEMVDLIKKAGFSPFQRDTKFNMLREFTVEED